MHVLRVADAFSRRQRRSADAQGARVRGAAVSSVLEPPNNTIDDRQIIAAPIASLHRRDLTRVLVSGV